MIESFEKSQYRGTYYFDEMNHVYTKLRGDGYLASSTLMQHVPECFTTEHTTRGIALQARFLDTSREIHHFSQSTNQPSDGVRHLSILATTLAAADIRAAIHLATNRGGDTTTGRVILVALQDGLVDDVVYRLKNRSNSYLRSSAFLKVHIDKQKS